MTTFATKPTEATARKSDAPPAPPTEKDVKAALTLKYPDYKGRLICRYVGPKLGAFCWRGTWYDGDKLHSVFVEIRREADGLVVIDATK